MPSSQSSATLVRPLRVAVAILTFTSVTRAIMEYAQGGPIEMRELPVRAVQILILLAVAALASPHRTPRTIFGLGFVVALTVPLANLVVLTIDPQDTWGSVTVLVAIVFGAALFAPWPWRWQAALGTILFASAALTILFAVPRAAFPWSDTLFALFLIAAVGVGSTWGRVLANRERHHVETSEARYRSLFDSAGDGIAVLDEDGIIRHANARLAALLGRPVEQIVGRTLDSFSAAAARGGTTASTEHLVALTGQLQRGTYTLRHAEGRDVEVEVSYARTEDPTTPQVQAIVHDRTEHRALERGEIKEQRLDALGQLAGGIAHQFNNVMAGILTHAGVLRADAANAASAKELDEIIDASRRGRELTQELLRFTKSAPLTLRPTAPGQLLESVAALARSSLPEGITIDVKVAPDVPPLQGDADHLVHACLELVLNARDAMQTVTGGRLTLTAAVEEVSAGDNRWAGMAPGQYVCLTVGDNGRGMDAATRDRAFEPFFTTKPMHRAAGIGLPKVSGVVRDHKGAIRVESTPGRGTTVHMLFPIGRGPVLEAPTPVAKPVAAAAPATILIVDDEAIVRHSLRRALTKFGYRVLEAGDGPSALAELQAASPPVNLVILDLVLPGGGAGILELLRAIRPGLKVLVSSGYSPEADTVKDLIKRVEGFLPKPYEMAELRAAVTKALAS